MIPSMCFLDPLGNVYFIYIKKTWYIFIYIGSFNWFCIRLKIFVSIFVPLFFTTLTFKFNLIMVRLSQNNRHQAIEMIIAGMLAFRTAQHFNVHPSILTRLRRRHKITDWKATHINQNKTEYLKYVLPNKRNHN